jgi:ferredoxin
MMCPQRSPLEETRTDASIIVRLSCLAWLSPTLILALVAQGPSALWLDDTHCSQCPLAANGGAILTAAAAANRMLALIGHPMVVHCYGECSESLQATRRGQVVDPRQPAYSRRGFFGALRRLAAESASTVAEQNLPATPKAKLAPHLPADRSLLGAALPRLGPPPAGMVGTSGLPLAQVTVSPECTACGLCAKLCPSGALAFRSDAAGYVLECTHLSCLGETCHLCRLICPVQAVTLSFQVDLAELVQGQPILLRAGQLTPCSRCGVPTAGTEGEALCHACRLRDGVAARPSFG